MYYLSTCDSDFGGNGDDAGDCEDVGTDGDDDDDDEDDDEDSDQCGEWPSAICPKSLSCR